MATAAVLDLATLLEPIPGDRPVGADLREDTSPRSTYYAVRDQRNTARTAERQAQMNGESPTGAGDWSPLVDAIPQILQQSSKDLEFAAYLIEALARKHGFAGMRDGFRLVQGLVERYGDDIYPLPDEDGLETRLAALTGLNGADGEGTLVGPIRNTPLTEKSAGEFTTASYEQALDLERAAPEQREHRLAQGAVEMAKIQSAIAQSRTEFLVQQYEDIQECLAAYADYEAALDQKYGTDAPPTSNIRNALRSCKETLETLARDRIIRPEAPSEESDAPETAGAPRAVKAAGAGGPIQSREDAFRQLQEIAQYFRRTEPHTPITFAIEQVVRWGRMPLPDLLRELIPEPSITQQMFRLVGIPNDQQQQ